MFTSHKTKETVKDKNYRITVKPANEEITEKIVESEAKKLKIDIDNCDKKCLALLYNRAVKFFRGGKELDW